MTDKRDKVIADLKHQLVQANERLGELDAAMRRAQHPCADEKHCSCVPLLHAQIAKHETTQAKLLPFLTWAEKKLRCGGRCEAMYPCIACLLAMEIMRMTGFKPEDDEEAR